MSEKYYNLGAETEQLEHKRTTGELREGIQSIASILNKHGEGDLYFGTKNNGDVLGQEVVSKAVRENIVPRIHPDISCEEYDGRKVIHVHFKGSGQPYVAYNVPRIRSFDEDSVMDQDTYKEMLMMQDGGKFNWERKVSKYTIADIDMDVFTKYLNKAKKTGRIYFDSDEPKVVLDKLELTSGENLLNAGAALFCNISTNDVQMAKFATDVRATFTDIRRYDKGSILGLADICEQYIKDAMDWKADIVGFERIETPEVPVEAVREAIINSYGHRVYDNNQCNEIVVFKNRIEIHTTGGFPRGHTPEEFLSGDKRAIRRNKLITQTLYYSKEMETFATGLKRIKDLCDEAGCKVEFRMELDNFVVVFYRNLRDEWNSQGEKYNIHNPSDNVAQDVARNVAQDVARKDLEALILELIKSDKKVTRATIAAKAGVTVKTVERAIKKMDNIEFVGRGSNGYWVIK